MRRLVVAGLVLAGLGAACAPDPLDTYASPEAADAPPATRPPLPTTTVPEGGDAAPVPTFAPNGTTIDVRSLDNSFIEANLEVEAGTEVRWTNNGRNDHNVLPVDESLTWGVEREDFLPGDVYARVFDTPGVYPYYCSIHGTKEAGMIGTVIVTDPA